VYQVGINKGIHYEVFFGHFEFPVTQAWR